MMAQGRPVKQPLKALAPLKDIDGEEAELLGAQMV
jgi:hypothetical protein